VLEHAAAFHAAPGGAPAPLTAVPEGRASSEALERRPPSVHRGRDVHEANVTACLRAAAMAPGHCADLLMHGSTFCSGTRALCYLL
jgi:hypothetical protein